MSTKPCPHCGGTAHATSASHNSQHCATHSFLHGYPVLGLISLICMGLQKLGVMATHKCEKCSKEF